MKNFKIVKKAIWEETEVYGVTKNGTYFVLTFKSTPSTTSIQKDVVIEYVELWYGADHKWHCSETEVLTPSNSEELRKIKKNTKKFFATKEDVTSFYLAEIDEHNHQQKINLINTIC